MEGIRLPISVSYCLFFVKSLHRFLSVCTCLTLQSAIPRAHLGHFFFLIRLTIDGNFFVFVFSKQKTANNKKLINKTHFTRIEKSKNFPLAELYWWQRSRVIQFRIMPDRIWFRFHTRLKERLIESTPDRRTQKFFH